MQFFRKRAKKEQRNVKKVQKKRQNIGTFGQKYTKFKNILQKGR